MSDNSKIEWTDATWNPVRGCSKVSPGCVNCYAETFAERFRGVPGHPFEQGFDLRLVPEKLAEPLRWRSPGSTVLCGCGGARPVPPPRETSSPSHTSSGTVSATSNGQAWWEVGRTVDAPSPGVGERPGPAGRRTCGQSGRRVRAGQGETLRTVGGCGRASGPVGLTPRRH